MFKLFNDKEETPQDVKAIREGILQFIKDQLAKVEGGEGNNIKGLHLYIAVSEGEKHLYEAALYTDEEDRFKNDEVQRIADDYAIELPHNWNLDITFTDALPAEAAKASAMDVALIVQTRKQPLKKQGKACIKVLNGEAEMEQYDISSESGMVTIGREKKVKAADGFFRINTIAFPADSADESNKFISRQHAHIQWDADSGAFLLFADDGGVPPRNKVKVRSASGHVVKLQTTQVGHLLQPGDQIILGETALLEFTLNTSL